MADVGCASQLAGRFAAGSSKSSGSYNSRTRLMCLERLKRREHFLLCAVQSTTAPLAWPSSNQQRPAGKDRSLQAPEGPKETASLTQCRHAPRIGQTKGMQTGCPGATHPSKAAGLNKRAIALMHGKHDRVLARVIVWREVVAACDVHPRCGSTTKLRTMCGARGFSRVAFVLCLLFSAN